MHRVDLSLDRDDPYLREYPIEERLAAIMSVLLSVSLIEVNIALSQQLPQIQPPISVSNQI